MKIVHQYNSHAAILACLESLLADRGVAVEQRTLVGTYPHWCQAGQPDEGSLDFSALPSMARTLGLRFQALDCDAESDKSLMRILDTVPSGTAVLLATRHWDDEDDVKHCVRFSTLSRSGEIEVMDPKLGEMSRWSWQTFRARQCILVILE
jgi:hypothetical protein